MCLSAFLSPHTQGQGVIHCGSGFNLDGLTGLPWVGPWRVSAEDRTSRTVPFVRKSCCADRDPRETPNWKMQRTMTMVCSATVGVSTTQPYTQGSRSIEQEGVERARGPGCLLLGSVSQVQQESCTHEILPIWLLK